MDLSSSDHSISSEPPGGALATAPGPVPGRARVDRRPTPPAFHDQLRRFTGRTTAAGSGSARIVSRDLPSAPRLQLASTGSAANIGPLVCPIHRLCVRRGILAAGLTSRGQSVSGSGPRLPASFANCRWPVTCPGRDSGWRPGRAGLRAARQERRGSDGREGRPAGLRSGSGGIQPRGGNLGPHIRPTVRMESSRGGTLKLLPALV